MKKTAALLLALVWLLSLCACGGADQTGNEAAPEEPEESLTYEEITFSQKTVSQELEWSLDEARIADHVFVPYGSSGDANVINVFRPIKAGEGNVLLIVSGTIRNTGAAQAFLNGNAFAEFVLDGGSTYGGKVTLVHTGSGSASTKAELAPLMEAQLYVTAELPQEAADAMNGCDVIVAFHPEGFSVNRTGSSMSDVGTRYRLSLSREAGAANPITEERFEPIEYQLGEQISTETIELNFSEIVLMKQMRLKVNRKWYSTSDAPDGTHNLCLAGTMMSKAKSPLTWTKFSGSVEIDGYTYELEKWVIEGHKLPPMFETKVFLYANVPDSLLENFENCCFKFAFNEEMTNLWWDYEECDYAYRFSFGPEAVGGGLK